MSLSKGGKGKRAASEIIDEPGPVLSKKFRATKAQFTSKPVEIKREWPEYFDSVGRKTQ